MRLLKLSFIVLFLTPCISYAGSYSQELTHGLVDLKNSVERLSTGNETLSLKNTQLKGRINEYQLVLQKSMDENRQLNNNFLKQQASNPTRSKHIERLQGELEGLDKKLNDWVNEFKKAQEKIAQNQKEDEALSHQIDQMEAQRPADNAEEISQHLFQEKHQKQKERMAVLKLILESQNHQDLLRAQIQDFQKEIPGQDAITRAKDSRKKQLDSKIQQLQDEIAFLNSRSKFSSKVWSQEELRQLQGSISGLEKNRDELQGLVAKMKQKAQKIPLSLARKHEESKLQAGIDQLKNEARGLKFDLEELQKQMVSLDKRKAYLETLL